MLKETIYLGINSSIHVGNIKHTEVLAFKIFMADGYVHRKVKWEAGLYISAQTK